MILKNSIRNREAKSCSGSDVFGAEEWIKDALLKPRRDTGTAVLHDDGHVMVVHGRLHGNLLRRHFSHGIARVREEIDKNLLELDRTAAYQGIGGSQIQPHLNLMETKLFLNQRDRLRDDIID